MSSLAFQIIIINVLVSESSDFGRMSKIAVWELMILETVSNAVHVPIKILVHHFVDSDDDF